MISTDIVAYAGLYSFFWMAFGLAFTDLFSSEIEEFQNLPSSLWTLLLGMLGACRGLWCGGGGVAEVCRGVRCGPM